MRVLHVPAQGKPEVKDIDGSLGSLQALVGGYIEALPGVPGYANEDRLTVGTPGYANEEGLIKGLPYNALASGVRGSFLVGDVVFTGGVDKDGNDLSISDALAARWS